MAANRVAEKMTEVQDIFVSVVIVMKSDTHGITRYVKRLTKLLTNSYTNYEVVIVDNGMSQENIHKMTDQLLRMPCIRIIRLSQNFSHDTALFAGLEVSIGDFVCTMDPSIDPVDEITRFVAKNKHKDVIQGYSEVPIKGSVLGQAGRKLFYWYNRKYIGIDIPLDATYLASYSRKAVNSLTQSTRSQRHIRHLARRVGYAYELVGYMPTQDINRHKKVKTGFIEAIEIVVSYSAHPLRFVTWIGLLAAFGNFVYTIYVIIQNVFNHHLAEGWTTTSLQLSIMFFFLFTTIVIISEYIGRILTEIHKDAHYFVADELSSSIALVDADKRNILK